MLTSFADLVALSPHPYTRPVLVIDGPMVVKAGRHPVVCILPVQQMLSSFVANDTFLSPLENLHIVTGPNGAGKVRDTEKTSKHLRLNPIVDHTVSYLLADSVHKAKCINCNHGPNRMLRPGKTCNNTNSR
jgi:hypothetical protein